MLLFQTANIGAGDPIRQRATRLEIRDQDGLVRVDDLGRLCHEVDAGEDDDLGFRVQRQLGEGQ